MSSSTGGVGSDGGAAGGAASGTAGVGEYWIFYSLDVSPFKYTLTYVSISYIIGILTLGSLFSIL